MKQFLSFSGQGICSRTGALQGQLNSLQSSAIAAAVFALIGWEKVALERQILCCRGWIFFLLPDEMSALFWPLPCKLQGENLICCLLNAKALRTILLPVSWRQDHGHCLIPCTTEYSLRLFRKDQCAPWGSDITVCLLVFSDSLYTPSPAPVSFKKPQAGRGWPVMGQPSPLLSQLSWDSKHDSETTWASLRQVLRSDKLFYSSFPSLSFLFFTFPFSLPFPILFSPFPFLPLIFSPTWQCSGLTTILCSGIAPGHAWDTENWTEVSRVQGNCPAHCISQTSHRLHSSINEDSC